MTWRRRLHDWWIESDVREVIFGIVPERWVHKVEDWLFRGISS